MIRVSIASILANRFKFGEKVWLAVVGASSSGKSQLVRPIAKTDTKFIHRIDDLTENALMSGMGESSSLLSRIGTHGVLMISDLTVLFSKSAEARSAILSQFRMVYDGEMSKASGGRQKVAPWKGYVGVLAGCTPSIYGFFEEYADMGERFLYYRMKDIDVEKATRKALLSRTDSSNLDDTLSDIYKEYIEEVGKSFRDREDGDDSDGQKFSQDIEDRIVKIAMFAEKLRAPSHFDKYRNQIDRIPVVALPMRLAKQLMSVARGLSIMRHHDSGSWELNEKDMEALEWCGYSMANEERRMAMNILAKMDYSTTAQTQVVADMMGLDTTAVHRHLQHLASVGVLRRTGMPSSHEWRIADEETYLLVRRINHFNSVEIYEQREMSFDDDETADVLESWTK
jgi:hypothetical protein